jgi:hypothetical protein
MSRGQESFPFKSDAPQNVSLDADDGVSGITDRAAPMADRAACRLPMRNSSPNGTGITQTINPLQG